MTAMTIPQGGMMCGNMFDTLVEFAQLLSSPYCRPDSKRARTRYERDGFDDFYGISNTVAHHMVSSMSYNSDLTVHKPNITMMNHTENSRLIRQQSLISNRIRGKIVARSKHGQ